MARESDKQCQQAAVADRDSPLRLLSHSVSAPSAAWTALLRKIKDVLLSFISQPVDRLIYLINPILRGWVYNFRIGHSSRYFSYVKDWIEKKIRRHMMHARKRGVFGWKMWSRIWLYETLGLFNDYRVRYYHI